MEGDGEEGGRKKAKGLGDDQCKEEKRRVRKELRKWKRVKQIKLEGGIQKEEEGV